MEIHESEDEEEEIPGPGSPHEMIGVQAIAHWPGNHGLKEGQEGFKEMKVLEMAYMKEVFEALL